MKRLKKNLEIMVKRHLEGKIKNVLGKSGLVREREKLNINQIITAGAEYLDLQLTGEAILTVGSGIEAKQAYDGIISLYPFGCMPGRIAEFFLKSDIKGLPFLSLEVDGNRLPPVIEAKLDSFIAQVKKRNRKK